MSIISKLPKKVNEWLVTGQKLGLLTEKQKNDFIAKYISLRQAGRPEVKFRKPRNVVTDVVDKALDKYIEQNPTYVIDDNMVNEILKMTGSVQVSKSMLYHRNQKRVDRGVVSATEVSSALKLLIEGLALSDLLILIVISSDVLLPAASVIVAVNVSLDEPKL